MKRDKIVNDSGAIHLATEGQRFSCVKFFIFIILLTSLFLIGESFHLETNAAEEQNPVLRAQRAETPPIIDGNLSDDCWNEASKVTGFFLNTNKALATEQTTAYLLYDEQNLYIAFKCNESNMKKIKTTQTRRDGDLWLDDCVEVFLDTNDDQSTYYHFIVNPIGTQFDEKCSQGGMIKDMSWNAVWRAKTKVEKDCWTVEMAIPFGSLEITPQVSNVWGINFNRGQVAKQEYSSWSPVCGSFHAPTKFGSLSALDIDFSKYIFFIKEVVLENPIPGRRIIRVTVENKSNLTKNGELICEIISPSGERDITSKKIRLKGKEAAVLSLPYKIKRRGKYGLNVALYDQKSKLLYSMITQSVNVPPPIEISIKKWKCPLYVQPEIKLNIDSRELYKYQVKARLFEINVGLISEKTLESISSKEVGAYFEFDVENLPVSNYAVEAELLKIRGRKRKEEIASARDIFRKVERIIEPMKGAGVWVYGINEKYVDDIKEYNQTVSSLEKKIRYIFCRAGEIDLLNSKKVRSYNKGISKYYKKALPESKIYPMLDAWGDINDLCEEELKALADNIADKYNNDPNADGIHLDIEPYKDNMIPLIKMVRSKTLKPVTLAAYPTSLPEELFSNAEFVVLMNYDIDSQLPKYNEISKKRAIEFIKSAEKWGGYGMIGIPAIATHHEWEYTQLKSDSATKEESGYQMEEYLEGGLNACREAVEEFSNKNYLGFSIWAFLPPNEPVGLYPASHPSLYYPVTIDKEEWKLLCE